MDKITLLLMTKKGFMALEGLLEAYGKSIIERVIVARDEQVSQDYADQILDLCDEKGIKVFERREAGDITSRYVIAISWRWIIPNVNGKSDLIVFHDSLLPKYRGFSPLVNQLIQKETAIGVTAFLATSGFDEGPIVGQTSTGIEYPIKIEEAIDKVSSLYKELLISICGGIIKGKPLIGMPQEEKEATYSLWRDENDYIIDWAQSSEYIKRFIDAVGYPYLGAVTKMEGKTVRIIEADIEKDEIIINRDCGKVLFIKDGEPIIVCGKGMLRIKKAYYEDTKESILPLSKFRTRFI